MPTVIAGSAAAAAGAWAAGTVTTIKGFAAVFAANAILGGAIRALTKEDRPTGGSQNRGRGRTQTVRESIAPRDVAFGQVRKGGVIVLLHTTGNSNKTLHIVVALADHEIKAINKVYFGDRLAAQLDDFNNLVPVSPFTGNATFEYRLGEDTQSAIPVGVSSSIWGSDHRLRGVPHVYARLEFDVDIFPNGIPNISVEFEGYNGVNDPRTSSAGYSRNPALCLAEYLTNTRWGLGVDPADINQDALIEAANVCDEDVTLSSGGTEKRYRCDGVFSQDQSPQEIIEDLLSSMAGEAVVTGGHWVIHAGAFRDRDIVYNADNFRDGLALQTRISRRENFNIVQGTFISPENNWEPSDFPPFRSQFYIDKDGREITRDIELPFTISGTAAQRIAKIQLQRARLEQTLRAPLDLSGLLTRAGDTVGIDYARWGFSEKPFFVEELAPSFANEDSPLGVDVVLRETSPLVYDWDASEEEVIAAAPPTNLPSAFDVPQPDAPTVSEELYVTRRSAGVRVLVELDWTGSETAFVDRFQVEIQPEGGSWRRVPSTEETRTEIRDVEPGKYRFRIRAVNRLGVTSNWAATPLENIIGTDAAPQALTGLTLSAIGGMAVLRWNQSPDLDVIVGGSIQFRHARQQTGATWSNSVSMGERLPGSATEAVLPLKPGTYLAKPRDAQGQPAASSAKVVTKAGEVLSFGNVDRIEEDPSWAGEMTNVEEDGGNLVLIDENDVGIYDFAAGFDFGSVRKFRLRTDLAVSVVTAGLSIDDRTDNIDSWGDFDGTADAEVDFRVFVRTTDDAVPTLHFDGGNDYVDLPTGILDTTSKTVEVTVQYLGTPGNIVTFEGDVTLLLNVGGSAADNDRIYLWTGTWHDTGVVAPSRFFSLAATYDDSNDNWRVFLNGSEILAVTDTLGTASDPHNRIGNDNGGITAIAARIFELRVWDLVRTDQEIQDNLSNRLTGSETGMIAYWQIDENGGGTIFDSSGSNDGTISGPTWSEVVVESWAEWSDWERIDSAEYEARGADFRLEMSTEDGAYLPQVTDLAVDADEVL